MAIKGGHETTTSDPGVTQVQKRVKVADLVQDSRMKRGLIAPLSTNGPRQKSSLPQIVEEKVGEPRIASVQKAEAEPHKSMDKSIMHRTDPLQTSVIEDVMSQKALQLSLDQLTSISPSARIELKTKLTEKHRKKRSKQKLSAGCQSYPKSWSTSRLSYHE